MVMTNVGWTNADARRNHHQKNGVWREVVKECMLSELQKKTKEENNVGS